MSDQRLRRANSPWPRLSRTNRRHNAVAGARRFAFASFVRISIGAGGAGADQSGRVGCLRIIAGRCLDGSQGFNPCLAGGRDSYAERRLARIPLSANSFCGSSLSHRVKSADHALPEWKIPSLKNDLARRILSAQSTRTVGALCSSKSATR
jgi:hypothetical protein